MARPTALSRRSFLRATLVLAGATLAGCSGDAGSDSPTEDRASFPQSVASGDPKPDAVILWTRIAPGGTALAAARTLAVQVARDPEFTERVTLDGGDEVRVQALPDFDGCVKVRVTGLDPDTVYYYRFIDRDGDAPVSSPVGRTRTAPAPDADRPVRFAFVSCQDYVGRYYNALARLASEDLDFVVHLGDYIYETSGDPGFQGGAAERSVTFTDEAGAIELGTPDDPFYAARSLDNYRQLYRTYRADPALQRLHEQVPFIPTWDDHEFADDAWGATATHFAGRMDEFDPERRQNANQAWFEYMPVDYADPDFVYDRGAAWPDDIRIWRDLRFGRHVHLVMTDLRSYRADHLIPEDAYPGAVAADQAALMDLLGAIPDDAAPYVEDIASYQGGMYVAPLQEHATAAGADPARVSGAVSAAWIAQVLADLGSNVPPIDDAELATLPRGYSYLDAGKSSYFSRLGSRYLVAKTVFDTLARLAYTADPARQEVLGPDQEAWFLSTITQSNGTWKVWGNEYCLVPLQIDLSTFPLPPSFQRAFYLNVDQWDGFRDRRDALLSTLADVGGVVAITGDIHAFFAGLPHVDGDLDRRIHEFVGSSVSSGTYQALLATAAQDLNVSGAEALANSIQDLLTVSAGPNPHLAWARTNEHGVAIVEADAAAFTVSFLHAPTTIVESERYDEDLTAAFPIQRLQVRAGDPTLWAELDGTWKRWDPTTYGWV